LGIAVSQFPTTIPVFWLSGLSGKPFTHSSKNEWLAQRRFLATRNTYAPRGPAPAAAETTWRRTLVFDLDGQAEGLNVRSQLERAAGEYYRGPTDGSLR